MGTRWCSRDIPFECPVPLPLLGPEKNGRQHQCKIPNGCPLGPGCLAPRMVDVCVRWARWQGTLSKPKCSLGMLCILHLCAVQRCAWELKSQTYITDRREPPETLFMSRRDHSKQYAKLRYVDVWGRTAAACLVLCRLKVAVAAALNRMISERSLTPFLTCCLEA